MIACIEEAQNLLTVTPPTLLGKPERKTTFLAKFIPCSASGKAHPRIRSSTSSTLIEYFLINPLTTSAAKSSGLILAKSPFMQV